MPASIITVRPRAALYGAALAALGAAAAPPAAAQAWPPGLGCARPGTVLEMVRYDPVMHTTLADRQALAYPPRTWRYLDVDRAADATQPAICTVEQTLAAAPLPEPNTPPPHPQPGPPTATQLKLEGGMMAPGGAWSAVLAGLRGMTAPGFAEVRWPMVTDTDAGVGNTAEAARYTALGIAPMRTAIVTAASPPTITDHVLRFEGVERLQVPAGSFNAARYSRCEVQIQGQRVIYSTWWMDTASGALLQAEIGRPAVLSAMDGTLCRPIAMSGAFADAPDIQAWTATRLTAPGAAPAVAATGQPRNRL
jgi:hypothetical protein